MDAAPPTPPAVMQAANQPALDALARLATTRRALADLMSGLPSLEVADAEGVSRLQLAWSTFWSGTEGGETRVALLASHLRHAMRDAAALRVMDGTLDTRAGQLVSRALRGSGDNTPAGVHARELMFGDAAYAGALILTDDSEPNVALLFTTEAGWEAGDSIDQLLQSARRHLLEPQDARMTAGMDGDTFAHAQQQGLVGVRALEGPICTTLATRMIDTRSTQLAQAGDDFALDQDDPSAATRLADRARRIIHPDAMVDIEALDTLRSARLVEATVQERLAAAPESIRSGWLEARDSYNETLQAAADLRNELGLAPPLSLRAFASQALATRLQALGIDDDPASITIELTRLPDSRAPLELLDHLIGQAPVRRVPFVDLAYENIGWFALDSLRAVGANGESLRPRLGHDAVRRIVRELDLANSYQAHVEARMRQGTGALSRQLAVSMQHERMRLEAAEARLSYYLPSEPASLIDDRSERGFRWIEAALDTPAAQGRRPVEGHPVVVSQLTYKNIALADILVIDVGAPNSVPRLVMYTPSAPDGIAFREFEDRHDAARRFLYHPSFREYLLDRLPAEFARVLPNGSAREFAGDHRAQWVLGAADGASYTLTDEPFREAVVTGNFLEAAYDTAVSLAKQDAWLFARTTSDADREALFAHPPGQLRLDGGRSLVGYALAEVPGSLVRALHASWRLYDHVKAGDTEQAFVALAEGYTSALNLLMPPFVHGRSVAQSLLRSQYGAASVVAATRRVARPRVVFESRYAVKALRNAGKPDHEGIYRVAGRQYLQHDGTFYAVNYHPDYATWRLTRGQGAPAHPDFTGPAVERVGGQWQFNQDVGLNGGMRRVRDRFRRVLRLNDAPAPQGAPAAEGAAAAEAAPAMQWQQPLPPAIEHLRGDIEAVLMANPSASLLYRHDVGRVRYEMRARSALILDPHLNPEVAALSPHQRRVFLHDIEQRFPQILERNDVLMTRGWARDAGHRLPDRDGGTSDSLLQSTDITSSSGSPPPARPALTPSQQARWNEALATARQASRSSPRTSLATDTMDEMVPIGERVPVAEWPERVWFFSERPHRVQLWAWNRQRGVTLDGELAPDGTQTGLRTHPVSTLPPETPSARLSEVLGVPVGQPGQRDPLGHWVRIDLRDLGASGVADRRDMAHAVRRRILPSGEYQYTIESTRPVRIPERFIQGGRRYVAGQRVHIGVVPAGLP